MILEDELQAEYGIFTLVNRCLLTISPIGKLMMHQLLQEMARKGSDTIKGLSLDMRKVEQGMRLESFELGDIHNSESEIDKIEKALSSLVGVKSVSVQKEIGKLIVVKPIVIVAEGVDPIELVTCLRESGNMDVEIFSVKYLN
ncbi:hypothetical protein L1987_87566 [Smallanthus sonchifolius]|nr:hypothetical protein L1987_87566 [Smallanthus sonchifolius]